MGRISKWLKPGGLLFVHIFVSNALPYHFEVRSNVHRPARHVPWACKLDLGAYSHIGCTLL